MGSLLAGPQVSQSLSWVPPYHAHTGPFFLVLILGPLESPLPSCLVGLDQGPRFPTYTIPSNRGMSASAAESSISRQV